MKTNWPSRVSTDPFDAIRTSDQLEQVPGATKLKNDRVITAISDQVAAMG